MVKKKTKKNLKQQRQRWFLLAAAAAVVAYILMTTILPALRSRKNPPVNDGSLSSRYNSLFNDMNPTQLQAAEKYGITPVKDRSFDFDSDSLLQEISPCKYYDIDELTHSVPYLTQPAKDLLDDIGLMFRQKVDEKGLESCKIIVTSLLRTKADVARLQQVNANATSNSTHCYATTFDITYQRFRLTGLIGGTTYSEQLVEALAEVLQQLREKGRCYVRFERNQHCFHITSRD